MVATKTILFCYALVLKGEMGEVHIDSLIVPHEN